MDKAQGRLTGKAWYWLMLDIACSGKKTEVMGETKGDLVAVCLGIRRAGGLPDGRDG
jgi:hypothetical protein